MFFFLYFLWCVNRMIMTTTHVVIAATATARVTPIAAVSEADNPPTAIPSTVGTKNK